MCGIVAIKKLSSGTADLADLRRMSSTLAHRGPDGAGYALLDHDKLALGHLRLSIVDLQTGAQPMSTVDQSVYVTFNGEIYDYRKLREDLLARGCPLRTTSDTEVILYLYQEYGMDFLKHLNGEFAFILWDAKRERLIAVRDRVGIKPLFYYQTQSEILFSSEAKSILALDRVPRALSPTYLTGPLMGAFPKATSTFAGIQALKPGYFLMIERGKVHPEQVYWRHTYQTRREMSFDEAKEGVRHHFLRAVERRMVADVPVCAYLSGGVDSSLVTAAMSSLSGTVKAFNIGFPDSIYDESERAQQLARFFGVQFESIPCSMELLGQHFAKTLYHTEAALSNPGVIGKFLLSAHVRAQGFKVTLTGEGSDEIFAGYQYFKLEKLWRMMQEGGESRRRAARLWERFRELEGRAEGITWDRGARWDKTEPIFGFPSFLQIRAEGYGKLIPRLLNVEGLKLDSRHTPGVLLRREFDAEELRRFDPLQASLSLTLGQLAGYIIPVLGDRVEMAHSIEGRTPFLDRDLLEFTETVPPEYMTDIETLREKFLLREAFKDTLPEFMRSDHKHPFLSPSWTALSKTRAGAELFGEMLSDSALSTAGIFNKKFISQCKLAWKLVPTRSGLHKKLDLLVGAVLCVQMLSHSFVKNKPASDASFQMVDAARPLLHEVGV